MSLFQIVVAPLLFILFVRAFWGLLRGRHSRRAALVEAAIWLSAAVAIVQPDISMRLAHIIGIGRGADLLLYLFVLAVLLGSFYFHRRLQRLESEISETVRQLAIREALARWPNGDDGSAPREPEVEQLHLVPPRGSKSGGA